MSNGNKVPTFEDTTPVEEKAPSFEETLPIEVEKKNSLPSSNPSLENPQTKQPSLPSASGESKSESTFTPEQQKQFEKLNRGENVGKAPEQTMFAVNHHIANKSGEKVREVIKKQIVENPDLYSDTNPNAEKNKNKLISDLDKQGVNGKSIIESTFANQGLFRTKEKPGGAIRAVEQSLEKDKNENILTKGVNAAQSFINYHAKGVQKEPETRGDKIRAATNALENGDYKEALNYYGRALHDAEPIGTNMNVDASNKDNPDMANNSSVMYGMGNAYDKLGEKDKAKEFYLSAHQADPENPQPLAAMKYDAYKSGDMEAYQKLDEAQKTAQQKTDEYNSSLGYNVGESPEDKKYNARLKGEIEALNNLENEMFNPMSYSVVKMPIQMLQGAKKDLEDMAWAAHTGHPIDATLKDLSATAKMGMAVLAGTEGGVIFNAVAGGAEHVLPSKVIEYAMSPASSIAKNFFDYQPEDKSAQSLLEFGDLIGSAILMHKAGVGSETGVERKITTSQREALANKFRNNEPLTKEDIALAQDIFKEVSPSVIDDAVSKQAERVKKHVQENTPDNIKELTTKLEERKKALDEAQSPEAKRIAYNKITETNDALEQATNKHIEDNTLSAEQQARRTAIDIKIEDLQKDIDSNPEGSNVADYKQAIEDFKKEKDNIVPKAKEVKTEPTTVEKMVADIGVEKTPVASVELKESTPVKEVELYNGSRTESGERSTIKVVKTFDKVLDGGKNQIDLLGKLADAGDKIAKQILDSPNKYGYADLYLKNLYGDKYDAIKYSNEGDKFKAEEFHDLKEDKFYATNERMAKEYSDYYRGKKYSDPNFIKGYEDITGEKPLSASQTTIEAPLKPLTEEPNKIAKTTTEPVNQISPTEPPIEEPTTEGLSDKEAVRAVARKTLASTNVSEEFKAKLIEKGVNYVKENTKANQEEAKAYVDVMEKSGKLKEAYDAIMSEGSKMDEVSRGNIAAVLAKKFYEAANSEELSPTLEDRMANLDKAVDLVDLGSRMATKGGQIGQQIGQAFKDILHNTPEAIVVDAKRRINQLNDKALAKEEPNIEAGYKTIHDVLNSSEFKEAVKKEIARINKEKAENKSKNQKENIKNAIKSLKVNLKGKAFDATFALPAVIYNTALDIIEKALLAGVSLKDAILQGVDYVNKHHKDAWLKEDFKRKISDEIRAAMGGTNAPKVKLTEKSKAEILEGFEKKLTGLTEKTRNQLLSDVVQEIDRNGGLEYERFKELYAKALGLPHLTDEVKVNLLNQAKKVSDITTHVENLQKEFVSSVDKTERARIRKELDKSIYEATKLNDELSEMFRKEKNGWDFLISAAQLGVLGFKSLINNPFSNAIMLLPRTAIRSVSSIADFTLSQTAKLPVMKKLLSEGRTTDALAYWKGSFKYLPEVLKATGRDFVTGGFHEDYTRRDLTNKIRPMAAWKSIGRMLTGKEKATVNKAITSFLEGTVGVNMAGVGRLLGLGDKIFSERAKYGALYEIGTLKGLKGKELEDYMINPPSEDVAKAVLQGEKETYQQTESGSTTVGGKNLPSLGGGIARGMRGVEDWFSKIPGIGGPMKFLFRTNVLFGKTPGNIIQDATFAVLPELSIAKGFSHALKGERKQALEYLSKGAFWLGVRAMAMEWAKKGVITPTGQKNESPEEKQLKQQNAPPGYINLSAIQRQSMGEELTIQDGDRWVDYKRIGVPGIVFGTIANQQESKQEGEEDSYVQMVSESTANFGKSVLEQSVLANVNQFANAISQGGSAANNYLFSLAGTIESTVLPATITNLSKSTNKNMKELKDTDLETKLLNDFKNKTFRGDQLPDKVSMWGEPILPYPKDKEGQLEKMAYQLFDVTSYRLADTNSFGYKLYQLYKSIDDKEKRQVLPSIPKSKVKIEKTDVQLTPRQYQDYQTEVGKARKTLTQEYVEGDTYNDDDTETRLKTLHDIYKQGQIEGFQEFIDKNPSLENAVESE